MPELKDAVDKTGAAETGTPPATATEKVATGTTPAVVDATVVEGGKKEKGKKEKAKAKTEAASEDAGTGKKEKKAKTETAETEDKLRRPPMEQLVRDFENHLKNLEVGGKKLEKLEYKCGKVIYGLKVENAKDFRVIAFKARKKTKTVQGKSRCIFYFGISEDLAKAQKITGTSTTEFGKCSVQVKKPIQLVLDKTSFTENFGGDVEKVMTALKSLSELAVDNKNDQWTELQEKAKAKDSKKAKAKEAVDE